MIVDLSTFAAGREVGFGVSQIYDIDCYCRNNVSESVTIIISSEETSHVDFFLGLFLLLFGLSSGGSTTSGGTTGGGSTSSGSSGDGGEELGDILSFKGLGKESGPVRLNGVSGSLNNLVELLGLIGKNITR